MNDSPLLGGGGYAKKTAIGKYSNTASLSTLSSFKQVSLTHYQIRAD
jgi:hypothetical protein